MTHYKVASFGVKLIVQKYDEKVQNWVTTNDTKAKRLAKSLARPNTYSSAGEFLATAIENLWKDGNALIAVQKISGDKPYIFEILHTDGVRPVLDKKNLIKGYNVAKQRFPTAGKLSKFVPREEMIHVRLPNSEHLEWGISPLESVKDIQDSEALAMAWNKNIMSNSGATSFMLTTDEPLKTDQRTKIRRAIMEDTALEYAGMPLLLTHGIKPVSVGKTPIDLNIVEMAKLELLRIAGLLKIPVTLIDPAAGATQGTQAELNRVFMTTSVLPIIGHICEAMSHGWLYEEMGDKYRIWYDASGAAELRENIDKSKLDLFDFLANRGVTLNELNANYELGLQHLPTGDIRIINGVVIDWAGITPAYDTEANPHNLGDARSQGSTTSLAENPDGGEATLQTATAGAKKRKASTEKEIAALWRSIENDRAFMSSLHRPRVQQTLNDMFSELAAVPVEQLTLPGLESWSNRSKGSLGRTLDRLWYETATLFQQGFSKRNGQTKSRSRKALSIQEESEIYTIASARGNGIVDTATHWIIDFVQKHLTRGLSEEDTVAELRLALPSLSEFKAEVIVENEILAASNLGNRIGAERSGMYTLKVWRTQRDLKVRDSHQRLEGETQYLSVPYSNGLRFPCDPLGSPSETVNCRCFESYE